MQGTDDRPRHPEIEELQRLKALWDTHGRWVLIGVCAILLAITGTRLIRHRSRARAAAASRQLSAARSPEDLDKILSSYSRTAAAPLALIRLAKAYYNAGDYDVAQNKYIEFTAKFGEHEMVEVAQLGRVHCMEAKGEAAAALAAFAAFAADRPDHYLTPQATLGRARCLEQLGRFDEARVVYEDFVAAGDESRWAAVAEESLKELNKRIRRQSQRGAWGTDTAVLVPELQVDLGIPPTTGNAGTPIAAP